MKEIVLSIIVAFSLTTQLAIAVPPNYGYGVGYGGVPGATHLVGRDGLCLEMVLLRSYKPAGINFPTRLLPCDEKKQTQLWTVVGDGTIRPMNDRFCLAADVFYGVINKAVVSECGKVSDSNKQWIHKNDGTIALAESRMVLTGDSDYVTLQSIKYTPSQSWEVTESLNPMVANIEWLNNLCLQSTDDSSNVGLNGCNTYTKYQRWALYADGTIRQHVNRNYCLTSEQNYDRSVVVSKCEDKPQQRWSLNAKDSTIDHPNTNMVLDVLNVLDSASPLVIVTNHPDGSASQRWTMN